MELNFKKMHGLGNCFIMMDDRDGAVSKVCDPIELAKKVCDRNFGIGADGLILIKDNDSADFEMLIINEDGSVPEMCGNGIRCFAKFIFDEKISTKTNLNIATGAGIIKTAIQTDGLIEVDMGEPILLDKEDVVSPTDQTPIRVTESNREFTFVSMGNPHAVAFVDDFNFDWRAEGAVVTNGASFPNGTNVEYIQVINKKEVVMKVWERGCGETMACGTGACASAVAGVLEEKMDRVPVTIHLPGGDLLIHWNEQNRVMMTGPAVTVCTGTYIN